MYFYEIYLRGVKGIFTWQSEKKISIGARVLVNLRNRKKIGLVLAISEKVPKFKTQPILEIIDENFINPQYIKIGKEVAKENFTSVEKIMSLMVPEKFFKKNNPVQKDSYYQLIGTENLKNELQGKKQKQALEILEESNGIILAKELRKNISLITIKGLLEKNIIKKIEGKITNPQYPQKIIREKNFELTPLQKKVLASIKKSTKPLLLFGVTGSGKTEIYKKLGEELIEKNSSAQVLFLLPEIALTPQLIAEFKNVFGSKIAVWHSHLSEGEKIQEFARITSGKAQILVGARSAILIPLKNPKLVILDEEHEWTYKNEFAPRFWTHDIAEKIAKKFNAKLLFGSATPRIESFKKCEEGIWDLVKMKQRVFENQLPEVQIVNMVNEVKKGNYSPISEKLNQAILSILEEKKQAVIFLNKRGFSGTTMCKGCGHIFECPNCSVNMKMHQKNFNKKLICHFCGHLAKFPEVCPQCEIENFEFRGWGTQQVEEILKKNYPNARILRADADTMTKKNAFENGMQKFANHEIDILLGTQMIAKGLDFEKVELVGVVLADVGLSLPDFRSEERVFQLLTQVSGRAGRRKIRGKILVQTYNPDEKIFEFVKYHDTEKFIEWQISIRKKTKMPPYSALGKVTFSDEKKEIAFMKAKKFLKLCQNTNKNTDNFEFNFAPAFFPKMHKKYHFHVFIKGDNQKKLEDFFHENFSNISEKIDLKPVSIL